MVHVILFPVGLIRMAAVGIALGSGWKLGSHLADLAIGKKDVTKDKVAEFLQKVKEHPWLGKVSALSECKEKPEPNQSPCS